MGGPLLKLCVTPPFSINFRCQIENQVSDYRLLGASSSTISWREKAVNTNFMVFGLTRPWNLGQKKNMCVYGHPTHPIFQPLTLTFFIGNYSTLIFAINFYTEFGQPFVLSNQQQCFIYSTASFLSKLRAKKVT